MSQLIYCNTCGESISSQAVACPKCGAPQSHTYSEKSYIAALLLCFFLGAFGIHRFYVGKIGTGILMLLTFGGLGIWTLIDFIVIVVGNFTDKDGKKINR